MVAGLFFFFPSCHLLGDEKHTWQITATSHVSGNAGERSARPSPSAADRVSVATGVQPGGGRPPCPSPRTPRACLPPEHRAARKPEQTLLPQPGSPRGLSPSARLASPGHHGLTSKHVRGRAQPGTIRGTKLTTPGPEMSVNFSMGGWCPGPQVSSPREHTLRPENSLEGPVQPVSVGASSLLQLRCESFRFLESSMVCLSAQASQGFARLIRLGEIKATSQHSHKFPFPAALDQLGRARAHHLQAFSFSGNKKSAGEALPAARAGGR